MSSRKIILIVLIVIIAIIVAFFYALFYQSKTNVSDDVRFKNRLDKPIRIASPSTLIWNKNNLRFSNYSLNQNDSTHINNDDYKTIKHYKVGDEIIFYKAMRYKSMHVGETYYFLGKDTLDTGETIEFEYYTNSDYMPEIWETLDDFLVRKSKSN